MIRSVVRALAAVVLASVVALVVACGQEAESYAGYQRNPVPNVASVILPAVEPDGSETGFDLRSEPGELLLVYFGYTSCPDVCPTTLADVRAAFEDLGDRADRVSLAMISIDTEVDTPEVLANYVRSFIPDAVAIRSVDDEELRAAALAFGADYGVEEDHGVYHTASLYAVDEAGDVVLTWPFGIPSEDIAADLDQLLDDLAEVA